MCDRASRKESPVSLRTVRALLWCAITLVCAGSLFGLAIVAQGAATGSAAQTTLPLRIEPAEAEPVLGRTTGRPAGQLVLDHGTLKLRTGGAAYASLQAVDILVTGALWLLILIKILQLANQFASGQPFEPQSVRRLRFVGWSLIALNLWAWIRLIALPPVALAGIDPVVGKYHVLPSIAASVEGARNARVDSTYGISLRAVGLLVLVLAQAFRIGADLREDNEAIV